MVVLWHLLFQELGSNMSVIASAFSCLLTCMLQTNCLQIAWYMFFMPGVNVSGSEGGVRNFV